LRDGWRDVALGDVAEIVMGQSPPGETYNVGGEGRAFIQGCAEFGLRNPLPVKWCSAPTAKRALPGDVLLSVRAPVGRINRAAEELIIGRGVAAIRGKNGVLTDYLEAALLHREPELQAVAAGSTFTAVTKSHVETLNIPLPPVDEQRRIADLLAAVDGAIVAVAAQSTATLAARERFLGAAVDRLDSAERRSLGALAEVQSGISWTKTDELPPGDPEGMAVMGVANV
jgi:type I restriction enzyme S subunit